MFAVRSSLALVKKMTSRNYLTDSAAVSVSGSEKSGRVLIYPEKSSVISDFWREKYEKNASKYWDHFYKQNTDRFFKNRNYLDKEWGNYFSNSEETFNPSGLDAASTHMQKTMAVLEVGCGAGNTVFPLLAKYPHIFIYACDFSSRAVGLVQAHKEYNERHVNAFVCDVTSEPLTTTLQPASMDIITLVFMLSAVSPEKMLSVVKNIKQVLKPGGHVLLRDYANGDLAQERLATRDQKISDNFFVRGDGTRAFYFSEETLTNLFVTAGFECKEMKIHSREVVNRSRKIVMHRRWIQSVYHLSALPTIDFSRESAWECTAESLTSTSRHLSCKSSSQRAESDVAKGNNDAKPTIEVTFTPSKAEGSGQHYAGNCEDIESDLLGGDSGLFADAAVLELLKIQVGGYTVHAKCLSKENQHTIATTGLMLWESAVAVAELLSINPELFHGKTVLELGCGSVGVCSLMASLAATNVVATDGNEETLTLLEENLKLNTDHFPVSKISCKSLQWGCLEGIKSLRTANGNKGFDLIIGTDVLYVPEAVPLLFQTARCLLVKSSTNETNSLFILCYIVRHVSEADILAAAAAQGFYVKGLWAPKSYNVSNSNLTETVVKSDEAPIFKRGLENLDANFPAIQLLCFSLVPEPLQTVDSI